MAAMMAAYYNEHDPYAAAWLRELIAAGQIAEGEVDERDIQTVTADDVRGFVQCHFFAGIGGWSYALRLAGWPDDRPVWTGSCPCQPFSSAGSREGGRDDRHLWPHWARLIGECRPVTVFGEQVESAITHGWLDAVFDDLEREGYACGAVCLPAAGVGAPHIRQRVWFVADTKQLRRFERWGPSLDGAQSTSGDHEAKRPALLDEAAGFCEAGVLADTMRQSSERRAGGVSRAEAAICSSWILDGDLPDRSANGGEAGDVGDANRERSQGRDGGSVSERAGECSAWAASDLIWCRDGKYRPVGSGVFPLAHGVSGRVGRLRGYGNAIVPHVAAEVISAYLEIHP